MDVFTDEEGNQIADFPESHSEFEFEEINGETVVTNISRYSTQEARDQVIEMGVEAGLSQTLDCLDEYLASFVE